MLKKQRYVVPTTEVLEVMVEENVLQSGSPISGWSQNPVGDTNWGDESDDNGME